MRPLIRICIAAAMVVAVVAGLTTTGIASPLGKGSTPEKVKVLDNFYKPSNVKIKKGKKVTWKWGQDFNSHNVTLKKGPKGVKKRDFTSQTSSSEGFKFTKKFKKAGKYSFYCTIHPDVMRMTVKVKG